MSNNQSGKERDDIRTLKSATCPSVSGRSTLEFEVGIDPQKALYLRISGNSGGGIYSKHWIALSDLSPLLMSKEPISAKLLKPLFQGKSINTVGFMIAILISEGLLQSSDSKLRTYLPADSSEFKKRIMALCDDVPPMDEKSSRAKKTATKEPTDQT